MAVNENINVKLTLEGSKAFKSSMRSLSDSAKSFGKNLKNLGTDVKRFGRNISLIGAGAGVALGSAVKSAVEFEDGFSTVVTLLDESSFSVKSLDQGISGLKSGILELRKESGQSFESLNSGLFDLLSAGVSADDAISTLSASVRLATAGATDVDIAVKAVTATLTAFGDEAGTAQDVAEKFFIAQKFGVTTVEELASEFSKVGGLAKTLGVSLEETLASASALTANGAKPAAQAFTELRAVMNSLILAQSKSANFSDKVKDAISLENIERIGLVAALKQTDDALGNNIVQTQKLFGSVEAVSGILSLTGQQNELFTKTLTSMSDEQKRAVTFTDALNVKQETFAFAMKKLKGLIEAVSVSIGESFIPALLSFFDLLSKVIAELSPDIIFFFSDLGDRLSELSKRSSEDLSSTIDTIRSVTSEMISLFSGLSTVISGVIALFRSFFNVMSSIALIIPGVSGETLGFFLILLKLTGGLNVTKSSILLVGSAFKLLFTAIKTGSVTTALFSVNFIKTMKAISTASLLASKKVIASLVFIGTSMTSLTGIMGLAGSAAKLFWTAVTGPIGVVALIGGTIVFLISKFVDFDKLIQGIKNKLSALGNVLKDIGKAIASLFSGGSKDLNINVNSTGSSTQKFASGGHVRGSGTSKSDSIPAMLSNGEYVIKAASVKKFGRNVFDKLNKGVSPVVQRFADGGLVGNIGESINASIPQRMVVSSMSDIAVTPSISSGRPINLMLPGGETIKATVSDDTAKQLERKLRRADSAKPGSLPAWYK